MSAHSPAHQPVRADLDTAVPAMPDAYLLLQLLVELQEREHRYVSDLLHDGPMQEFTAVLLALGRVRTTLGADVGEQLAAIEARLRETVISLHRPLPPFRPGNDARAVIEMTLAQRVHGLLADALEVDVDVDAWPPTWAELPVLLAVIQLLLLTGEPTRPVARAAVAVRSDLGGVELRLQVVPAEAHETSEAPGIADAARIRAARLHALADAVGAQVECDPGGWAWRAVLTLPRPGCSAGR